MPDFSCYIIFNNNLNVDLNFSDKTNSYGWWSVEPPSVIKAKASMKCQLKDSWGTAGSEGSFTYTFTDANMSQNSIEVSFSCPYMSSTNTCSVKVVNTDTLYTCKAEYNDGGHPMNATCTIGYSDLFPNISIMEVRTLSTRAFPMTNIKNVIVGGILTDSISLWTPAEASDVKDDSTGNVKGSFRPVAFPIQSSANTIGVRLSDDTTNGQVKDVPLRLEGFINGEKVMSVDNARCNSEVTLTLRPTQDAACIAGDIAWHLTVIPSQKSQDLPEKENVRLEIYNTSAPATFFGTASFPLLVCRRFIVKSTPTPNSYMGDVTNINFSAFSFAYDTAYGSSRYTGRYGRNFQLTKWLSQINTGAIVNCYDMCGMVQIGLGLAINNTEDTWMYQNPYGYINSTHLVGLPVLCNNPFFKNPDKEEPVNPNPVCPINDKTRTKFGNHAYLCYNSVVYDACAGPTLGMNLDVYIATAIDQDTILKPEARGDSNTVGKYKGISMFDQVKPVSLFGGVIGTGGAPNNTEQDISQLMESAANRSVGNAAIAHSNANLSDLSRVVAFAFEGGTACVGPTYVVDQEAASIHWIFKTSETGHGEGSSDLLQPNSDMVEVDIEAHANHSDAVQAMTNHLGDYQLPSKDLFTPLPDEHKKGQYSLGSVHGDNAVMWIQGLLFIKVRAWSPGNPTEETSALRIASAIDQHLREKAVGHDDWSRPTISDISGAPTGPIAEGTQFRIQLTVSDGIQLTVTSKEGHLLAIETNESMHWVDVLARTTGQDVLHISFLHPATLAVKTRQIPIEITPADTVGPV